MSNFKILFVFFTFSEIIFPEKSILEKIDRLFVYLSLFIMKQFNLGSFSLKKKKKKTTTKLVEN